MSNNQTDMNQDRNRGSTRRSQQSPFVSPQRPSSSWNWRQHLGIINAMLPSPANAPSRSEEELQTIRLKLISAYFKFVVQSLCYLLAMYIAFKALSIIFSFSAIILIPAVAFMAVQTAARNMNIVDENQEIIAAIDESTAIDPSIIRDLESQEGELMIDTSADTQIQESLTKNVNWALNKGFWAIDKVSDYAVTLFQKNMGEAMKKATFLDNQIATLPANRR